MQVKKGIKIKLTKIDKGEKEEISDLVAREVSFSILLNEKKIATLQCTPDNYKCLGIGFLYSSGFIHEKKDILSIKIDNKNALMDLKMKDFTGTHNGSTKDFLQVGIYKIEKRKNKLRLKDFSLHIKKNQVFELMIKMQQKANVFQLTGCTHSCALANKNGIILFDEDISRYNTIDKIIGKAFLENRDTSDKIIFTSCRLTSGVLSKIISTKIPIVISRSAATDEAVKLAKQFGVTLVGFVRGEKMNIYSHPERIDL